MGRARGEPAHGEFVGGIDSETFRDNVLVRSAVERQFEIIGEALSQLAKIDPALASRVPEHRRIIAFRNVLIHGYAALDHQLVWRIIQEDLPPARGRSRRAAGCSWSAVRPGMTVLRQERNRDAERGRADHCAQG